MQSNSYLYQQFTINQKKIEDVNKIIQDGQNLIEQIKQNQHDHVLLQRLQQILDRQKLELQQFQTQVIDLEKFESIKKDLKQYKKKIFMLTEMALVTDSDETFISRLDELSNQQEQLVAQVDSISSLETISQIQNSYLKITQEFHSMLLIVLKNHVNKFDYNYERLYDSRIQSQDDIMKIEISKEEYKIFLPEQNQLYSCLNMDNISNNGSERIREFDSLFSHLLNFLQEFSDDQSSQKHFSKKFYILKKHIIPTITKKYLSNDVTLITELGNNHRFIKIVVLYMIEKFNVFKIFVDNIILANSQKIFVDLSNNLKKKVTGDFLFYFSNTIQINHTKIELDESLLKNYLGVANTDVYDEKRNIYNSLCYFIQSYEETELYEIFGTI